MAKPKVKPAHYKGTYHRTSMKLRAQWNADAHTVCWRCGRYAIPGDPWQAGHVVDGEVGGQLMPEHQSCNSRAGRLLAARNKRRKRAIRTALTW